MFGNLSVTAVIPALDEALNITAVVKAIQATLGPDQCRLVDHIIVCDNGSADNTAALARSAGAIVAIEAQRGYGAACLKALNSLERLKLKTDVVVFIDGDQSVDCNQIQSLLTAIQGGADLAIGARRGDQQEAGALSVPQQLGNKLATWLIRRLWGQEVTDLGPFRAIRYPALKSLYMQDRAFGWTVEMQVKAIICGLKTVEKPVRCLRRLGASKISGTVTGVIGAGYGILSTIFLLWLRARKIRLQQQCSTEKPDLFFSG